MSEDSRPLEKLFAGARLRRLRREKGLTQGEAAAALGLSPSYLNLLERNQRPVTARVLLALADAFDVDVRAFAQEQDRQLIADLQEAAADPLLSSLALDRMELSELTDSHPRAAEAMAKLFQSYREASAATADLAARMSGPAAGGGPGAALEAMRDALDARHNHFPELEDEAERLAYETELKPRRAGEALGQRLQARHGVVVRIETDYIMAGARRRLDFHGRRLLLSERVAPSSRPFHMAIALANLELGERLDALSAAAALPSEEAARLYRIGLANYFAGAVLAPYAAFLKAAEDNRYDLPLLQRRFELSFEQVCHRLTTLHRPGARGVAFFMLRVDRAGNVTKRHGGGVMPFARWGGGCPKWRIYDAFQTPGRVIAQSFDLPDGARHLSLACAGAGETGQAVAIGCDWADADKIIHADPLREQAPDPAGVSCRLCERSDCAQRAFPPLNRKLELDPHQQRETPYGFEGG
jgi:predicted transcriptional regulator/DNA-binding XRE family transcriptional regulator